MFYLLTDLFLKEQLYTYNLQTFLSASSHLIYLDLSGYFGCQIELHGIQVMTGHATFSPQKFKYICEAMRNQYCHFNFPSCGFTGHNLY